MTRESWELDGMSRPPVWSDEDWAIIGELMTHDSAWAKPIYHPDTYGLTSLGLQVARVALEVGHRPRVGMPQPLRSHDEGMGVRWRDDGITYYLARTRPEIWARLRPVPVSSPALELLATRPIEEHHRHRVTHRNGNLHVRVGVSISIGDVAGAIEAITDLAADYQVDLEHAPAEFGHRDLLDTFARAGLAAPMLPTQLAYELGRVESWRWSTWQGGQEQPSAMDDYRFQVPGDDWLEGPTPDHATISHAGHGLNSYALTWRMAWGPVALRVQDHWGGLADGPRDSGRLAELFA